LGIKLDHLIKKDYSAKAQTVIGYFDGKKYKSFVGEIEGKISQSPRGKNNFGWDSIFIPKGYKKTFAQMQSKEKNQISMRKIALEKFKKFIKRPSY
jgi:XTP/dITP diphosphohydrolase